MKPCLWLLLTYDILHGLWGPRGTESGPNARPHPPVPQASIVRASEVPSGPFVSGWLRVTLLAERGLEGSADAARPVTGHPDLVHR